MVDVVAVVATIALADHVRPHLYFFLPVISNVFVGREEPRSRRSSFGDDGRDREGGGNVGSKILKNYSWGQFWQGFRHQQLLESNQLSPDEVRAYVVNGRAIWAIWIMLCWLFGQ